MLRLCEFPSVRIIVTNRATSLTLRTRAAFHLEGRQSSCIYLSVLAANSVSQRHSTLEGYTRNQLVCHNQLTWLIVVLIYYCASCVPVAVAVPLVFFSSSKRFCRLPLVAAIFCLIAFCCPVRLQHTHDILLQL